MMPEYYVTYKPGILHCVVAKVDTILTFFPTDNCVLVPLLCLQSGLILIYKEAALS